MMVGRFNLESLQRRSLSAAILIIAVITILAMGGIPFIALLAVLAAISLFEWAQLSLKCPKPSNIIYLIAGAPYVMGSITCCFVLFEVMGFFWAMVFLLMVWASDSGAYFFGKVFGGPKMIEAVSPNKTWAGFVGAIVCPGIIGLFAIFIYRGINDFTLMAFFTMGMTGIIIGIAGQIGDLIISAFKRRAGVKDTGTIIPGHGGLLDRIDSMLLAAPVYLILFQIGHS
ncbi:MAG: phosphatidate cytidylyltransferase [Bdellovibrionales bacterium]